MITSLSYLFSRQRLGEEEEVGIENRFCAIFASFVLLFFDCQKVFVFWASHTCIMLGFILILFLLLLLQVILSPDAKPPVVRIMDYEYDIYSFFFFQFWIVVWEVHFCG